MQFNEKLKKLRTEAKLSQTELAKQVGITERSIYNYEMSGRVPKIDVVKRIADALNVSVDYLTSEADLEDSRSRVFLSSAKEQFGQGGAMDAEILLERTSALFAGGELNQEAKDAFFESITQAYFHAKNVAREKASKKEE